MRLKEDKSSWNASNILRKVTPLPERPTAHKSHKDTRKWCKEIVGREHDYPPEVKEDWSIFTSFKTTCTVCGKRKVRYDVGKL